MDETEVFPRREGMGVSWRHGGLRCHACVADRMASAKLSKSIAIGNLARVSGILEDVNRPTGRQQMQSRPGSDQPTLHSLGFDGRREQGMIFSRTEATLKLN